MSSHPIIELVTVSKNFGGMFAVSEVSMVVRAGEVLCLLGDNGAGKSTLISLMSGVYPPSSGEIRVDGERVSFRSPRDAQRLGIATVYQDVGAFPLMSVSRNFHLGREPHKGFGIFRRIDRARADRIALEELRVLGVRRITSGDQLVGTLSGGERQAVAVARATYFGARVLILDEPTAALGVKEAAVVLRLIEQATTRGIGVVFITHNATHAISVGDRFAVLIRGSVAAQFSRGDRTREELLDLMAGGEEMELLEADIDDREKY